MDTTMKIQLEKGPPPNQTYKGVPQTGLGLALSGGGARGLAHIGILEVIEEAGLSIGSISGASMGGVIGALYACGMSGAELHQLANSLARPRQLIKLVELRPNRRGLVSAIKLEQLLAEHIGPTTTFDDLRLPLVLTATDLNSGRQIHLRTGSVVTAVMATCAFPGVFPPVEVDGSLLVDGGVLNNLPVNLLNGNMRTLVAVDVTPGPFDGDYQKPPTIITKLPAMAQILYRSTMLMSHAATESILEERPPDVLVKPPIPSDIGVFDGFSRSEEIIQIGRRCMLREIDRVKQTARA